MERAANTRRRARAAGTAPQHSIRALLAEASLAAALLADACAAAPPAAAGWQPARAVEIIVPSGPGGAQDRTARLLQGILQSEKLVPTAVALTHRPGAGHALAAALLAQRAGDGHYLMTTTSTLLTTHILGLNRYHYTDFTPVALLSSEYVAFATRADGPIRTPADFVRRLKAEPEGVTFAFGTSRGNVNHIGIAQLMKAAGIDPARAKIVVYRASPEAMSALLGGHADCVAAPVSNFTALWQAGKLRVLALAAPRRAQGAFAAVPTWTELGLPAVSDNVRLLLGPKGLGAAELAFWDGALARLARHPEWLRDLETSGLSARYLPAGAAAAELERLDADYRRILGELGLAGERR